MLYANFHFEHYFFLLSEKIKSIDTTKHQLTKDGLSHAGRKRLADLPQASKLNKIFNLSISS